MDGNFSNVTCVKKVVSNCYGTARPGNIAPIWVGTVLIWTSGPWLPGGMRAANGGLNIKNEDLAWRNDCQIVRENINIARLLNNDSLKFGHLASHKPLRTIRTIALTVGAWKLEIRNFDIHSNLSFTLWHSSIAFCRIFIDDFPF